MDNDNEIPQEVLGFRLPAGRCPSVEVDGAVDRSPYTDGESTRFVWTQRLRDAERRKDTLLETRARRILDFVEGAGPFAQFTFSSTRCILLHDRGRRAVLLLREPDESRRRPG